MSDVLSGHNPTENIVAVQQLSDQVVRLYNRKDGKISYTDAEFFPFFFLSESNLLKNYSHQFWLKELNGSHHFRYLAAFSRWNEMWEAVRTVLKSYNQQSSRRAEHYSDAECLLLRPDPITQYLTQTGITLFKGMKFEELHRLQFSLETFSPTHKPSDARRTEDRIIVLALSDNRGWEEVIDGRKKDEKTMLQELIRIVVEKDPDVVEGHQLFENDLPYVLRRCEMHGLDFAIGRGGSVVKSIGLRVGRTEREAEPSAFELAGRHLIDTTILAQAYDAARRSFESFDLASLSQHFNLALSDRIILPPPRISWHWEKNPRLVIRHALDDVRETRLLSDLLSPGFFLLTQFCPLSFGTIVRSGSAMKIESLMLREYVRQKHSIPKPEHGTQSTGGYSDITLGGLLSTVIHADVESLYPSIMITREINPRTDLLGVFTTLLRELTELRLELKHQAGTTSEDTKRRELDTLQSTLKLLINSFYGYLGYARALFNDYAQADRVAREGQGLLQEIIKQVVLYNGKIAQVDTDGIYFVVPDNINSEEDESGLIARISGSMPEGINLAYAGRYKKMFSYKKKNYALLDYDDKLIVRGSSLISRSLERFARRFLNLAIQKLMSEDVIGLHQLYVAFVKDIQSHRWEASDFCRTETMRDSLDVYTSELEKGNRKPTPLYELVRRSGIWIKPGSRVSYYVTGNQSGVKISENSRLANEWDPNFPDENTAYYLSRLDECTKKLEIAFQPDDFRKIFSADDLFGFDAQGILPISKPIAAEEVAAFREEEESTGFGIWLAENGD